MPLLNFKKQFAAKVETGLKNPDHPEAKRQTVRAPRKDGKNPKAGQTLYLYTGLRTKSSRKLGEAVCTRCEQLSITENGDVVFGVEELDRERALRIARADGFESLEDFIGFFRKEHGLPFFGFLIYW